MSANLKRVSDADLAAEVERRKKVKEAGARPPLVADPDLKRLIATAEAHMESLAAEGFTDDDSQHYIYEEALKALYGPKVFEWIRKANR